MLRIQEIPVEKLKPWEDNPRVNDHAVDAIAASIRSFGFNVPVLCDHRLAIVAGHTRWKAAVKLGLKTIPVIRLRLSDKQRRAFSIADNKTAEIASWDFPKLRDVLKELRAEDVDLCDLGFSDEELRRLLSFTDVDEDAIPEVPSTPRTKPGDLMHLGNHRLLCADARDYKAIELLVAGNRVTHIFAGPPYFNQRKYAQWENCQQYLNDMRKIAKNCHRSIVKGGVVVWNIANDCSTRRDLCSHHSILLEEVGFQYLDTIAWVKTGANYAIPRNFHITRNRCYYPAFQWEALLVFQKPGRMPKMPPESVEYMSGHRTNVWEIAAVTRQEERYGHPAVCPVEIPYRSILAYAGGSGCLFEPFGGSGTTLIAAEKAHRRAFLMERNPIYCDMIVQRWEHLTGKKAKRLTRNWITKRKPK